MNLACEAMLLSQHQVLVQPDVVTFACSRMGSDVHNLRALQAVLLFCWHALVVSYLQTLPCVLTSCVPLAAQPVLCLCRWLSTQGSALTKNATSLSLCLCVLMQLMGLCQTSIFRIWSAAMPQQQTQQQPWMLPIAIYCNSSTNGVANLLLLLFNEQFHC